MLPPAPSGASAAWRVPQPAGALHPVKIQKRYTVQLYLAHAQVKCQMLQGSPMPTVHNICMRRAALVTCQTIRRVSVAYVAQSKLTNV